MTATNETYLPTYEELYVPPLNISSAALRAGAPYFGKFCDQESKVYWKRFFFFNKVNFLRKKTLIDYEKGIYVMQSRGTRSAQMFEIQQRVECVCVAIFSSSERKLRRYVHQLLEMSRQIARGSNVVQIVTLT